MQSPKWLVSPVLDWFFRILVIALVGAGVAMATDTYNRAKCQSKYNEAVAVRTKVLAEAINQEREAERRADDALTALTTGLLARVPQEESLRLFTELADALGDQQRERSEADRAREEHPPPPLPSEVCD